MSRGTTKDPTILLVEDDPVLRREFSDYLGLDGFEVQAVTCIAEAEYALAAGFDLMVLDINLPDGSGAEFCQRVRPYLRCGIVICSGRSERELRLSLLRSDADAFLVKPVDAEELSATLCSVFRRVSSQPASPMRLPQLPALWRLDRVQHCLWGPQGKELQLTGPECVLLSAVLEQPERMIDRQQLISSFERAALPINGPRLETLISRLRVKVSKAFGAQLPLRASYGRGYVFTAHAVLI